MKSKGAGIEPFSRRSRFHLFESGADDGQAALNSSKSACALQLRMSHVSRRITIVVREPQPEHLASYQHRQEEVDEPQIQRGDSFRNTLDTRSRGGDDNINAIGSGSEYSCLSVKPETAEVAISPCVDGFCRRESTPNAGCPSSWRHHARSGCCWCPHHQVEDNDDNHYRLGGVAAEDMEAFGEEQLILHVERDV